LRPCGPTASPQTFGHNKFKVGIISISRSQRDCLTQSDWATFGEVDIVFQVPHGTCLGGGQVDHRCIKAGKTMTSVVARVIAMFKRR
jgi:hypothetical protein